MARWLGGLTWPNIKLSSTSKMKKFESFFQFFNSKIVSEFESESIFSWFLKQIEKPLLKPAYIYTYKLTSLSGT